MRSKFPFGMVAKLAGGAVKAGAKAGAKGGKKGGASSLLSGAAKAAGGGKKKGGMFSSLSKMAKGAMKTASGMLNKATGGLLGKASGGRGKGNCPVGQTETVVGEVTICANDNVSNHCGANTYFSGGMCNPCAAEEYSEPGATVCLKGKAPTNSKKKCGPGSHWDEVAKLCSQCKSGYSSGFESLTCTELQVDALTSALTAPSNDCGAGTFKGPTGSCDRCDVGKASAPGSTFCVDVPASAGDNGCNAGTFFIPNPADATLGFCYGCPPKHASIAGSTACTPMGDVDTKNMANGLAAIQTQITALTKNLGSGAAASAPVADSTAAADPAADAAPADPATA